MDQCAGFTYFGDLIFYNLPIPYSGELKRHSIKKLPAAGGSQNN